jgi:uncharacterized protein Usg
MQLQLSHTNYPKIIRSIEFHFETLQSVLENVKEECEQSIEDDDWQVVTVDCVK